MKPLKMKSGLIPFTSLLAFSACAGAFAATNSTPSRPRTAAPTRPAPAAARANALTASSREAAALLPGLRHLPADPLVVGAVQVNAVDNFLRMMTGGANRDASGTDMMVGALKLLKDQIDGPLSVGLYPEESGKSFSLVMAARLRQSAFTRELLNGFITLGGDEKNPARQEKYKGQTLVSMDLPKPPSTPRNLPMTLQPTFTVTTTDYLLIGTSLPVVKRSIDVGALPGGALSARSDVTAMLREVPLNTNTDVWLFVPEPARSLKGVRTPLPIPLAMAGLPLGASVMALRFTPTGVRFEGLASVDRTRAARTPSRSDRSR